MASAIKANCRKVICIGRNYAAHIAELNHTKPKQPFFFLKPPSSILTPNSGPVLRPKGTTVHYEVELGLVMGKTVRDLDPSDREKAIGSISAYLVGIDFTGRNVQEEAKNKGLPWSIAKGFDTFLPISEPIPASSLPKTCVPDKNLHLWLSINGETKQSDETGLMIYDIPRQLSDISRVMTLEPGDIVLTGTPKGVGPIKPGDSISAGIRFNGKEIEAGRIDVKVEEKPGPYEFKET